MTDHSGRFGKFGFLADQAKFPPSRGFELWEDDRMIAVFRKKKPN